MTIQSRGSMGLGMDFSRIRRYSVQVIRMVRPLFSHTADGDLNEWECSKGRRTPSTLDNLCSQTKFTKSEVRAMYNGFKQDCPSGSVSKERFRELYGQYFPVGDASSYADHIFDAMDTQQTGNITFEQFLMTISVLTRGSFEEKIRWVFNLYDLNGDGFITRDEMETMLLSVYDLIGRKMFHIAHVQEDAREHAERIFERMDMDGDGIINFDDFRQSCARESAILRSMQLFDTVL